MFSIDTSPKVSIIMTTYNGGKYILETIESIRNQTHKNWELIVIDDGSTDNTCDIVNAVRDERIHVYKAGRIGINGALKNIGLTMTSGELIAFIDHDDLWAPEKIEKQVAALQQYGEAGFSLTGGYNFRKKGEPPEYFYKQRDGVKVDNVFNSFFRSELPGFTQALMMRKKCIDVAGPFNESKSFADVDFILKLAYHFKAVILYEPLLFRRIHDTNYIHSNWEKGHYERIEIIQSYKNKLDRKTFRDALFRSHINFGEKYILRKQSKKAIQHFFRAWGHKIFSMIPLKKMMKTIVYFFR
jgi:glycosyltransferase involved in cell wall biosynthesis